MTEMVVHKTQQQGRICLYCCSIQSALPNRHLGSAFHTGEKDRETHRTRRCTDRQPTGHRFCIIRGSALEQNRRAGRRRRQPAYSTSQERPSSDGCCSQVKTQSLSCLYACFSDQQAIASLNCMVTWLTTYNCILWPVLFHV